MNHTIAIGIPGGPEILLILFICFGLILPIVALVDIASNQFKDGVTKLIWVVIVIFAPVIGSVAYFVVGKGQSINKTDSNSNNF